MNYEQGQENSMMFDEDIVTCKKNTLHKTGQTRWRAPSERNT